MIRLVHSYKEQQKKKERKFHSCHKSSVAWYICGGVRDSGTKFILIDETLLERRITKENLENFCLPAHLTIKKKKKKSSELVLCLFNALQYFHRRESVSRRWCGKLLESFLEALESNNGLWQRQAEEKLA
jgi:hypothetical protein